MKLTRTTPALLAEVIIGVVSMPCLVFVSMVALVYRFRDNGLYLVILQGLST